MRFKKITCQRSDWSPQHSVTLFSSVYLSVFISISDPILGAVGKFQLLDTLCFPASRPFPGSSRLVSSLAPPAPLMASPLPLLHHHHQWLTMPPMVSPWSIYTGYMIGQIYQGVKPSRKGASCRQMAAEMIYITLVEYISDLRPRDLQNFADRLPFCWLAGGPADYSVNIQMRCGRRVTNL